MSERVSVRPQVVIADMHTDVEPDEKFRPYEALYRQVRTTPGKSRGGGAHAARLLQG